MKTSSQPVAAAPSSLPLFRMLHPARGAAALLLALACLAGCGGDSDSDTDGGGPGSSSGQEGIRTLHDGASRDAGVTVQSVNTFWFDEGEQFKTTVIAGWATREGSFGTITARLTIRGKKGEPVQAGNYQLIPDADDYEAPEMSATLSLEHGVASLPRVQRSVTGTLELKTLVGDGKFKLDRLALDFDGTFVDDGDDPVPGENAISGSIRFTR